MVRAHEVVEGVTSALDDEMVGASYVPVARDEQEHHVGIAGGVNVADEEYGAEGILRVHSRPILEWP